MWRWTAATVSEGLGLNVFVAVDFRAGDVSIIPSTTLQGFTWKLKMKPCKRRCPDLKSYDIIIKKNTCFE